MTLRTSSEVAPPTLVGSVRFPVQFSGALRIVAACYDAGLTFVLVRSFISPPDAATGRVFGLASTPTALILSAILLALMTATGMYRRWHAERSGQILVRLAVSQSAAVAMFLVIGLCLGVRVGLRELTGFAIANVVLITVGRYLYMVLTAASAMRRAVLLVGSPNDTKMIADSLAQDVYADTTCVGLVNSGVADGGSGRLPAVPTGTDILRSADLHGAKEILVVSRFPDSSPVYEALLQCRFAGLRVRTLLQEGERQHGKIDPRWFEPPLLAFGSGFGFANPWYKVLKRSIDLIIGSLLIIFVLPLCATIAMAIRLDDRGPVLYRQERVGRHGRTFMLLKFRSMRTDAEPDGVARWAADKDSRITRVGRFLRRSRFDELPQLVNVLRGEMSLIGPRPERPELTAKLEAAIPKYEFRHVVRPGITGWAQVNFPYSASIEDARQKLAYDLYYVKNCNLLLDLQVLVQTVRVVLWPDGVR